jgi:pyruvate dehydrogenase E2 component (dihydrolipoyllysine-residue acetyltransferase)
MTDAKLLEGFAERGGLVKGRRLRWFVGGPEEGAPLVLIHGLGGAAVNWTLLAELLAKRRRVVAVDLPGHGGSEPLPAAPSLAPYADRVARVAEAEGFARADYVGHSLGGLVALRLAIREPETVRRLVLAAAAGISSSTRWAERVLAFFGWLQPGRRISPHWRVVSERALLKHAVFGHWMAADPERLSPLAVASSLAHVNLHTDTDSAWRALCRDDPRRDLHLVKRPCLVLWGASDNQLPFADAVDYARRLRAPLRVIADCGHLLVLERPDACYDAIEEFLTAR